MMSARVDKYIIRSGIPTSIILLLSSSKCSSISLFAIHLNDELVLLQIQPQEDFQTIA